MHSLGAFCGLVLIHSSLHSLGALHGLVYLVHRLFVNSLDWNCRKHFPLSVTSRRAVVRSCLVPVCVILDGETKQGARDNVAEETMTRSNKTKVHLAVRWGFELQNIAAIVDV